MKRLSVIGTLILMVFIFSCNEKKQPEVSGAYTEQHRPQIHFSPKEKWMNDPNGMVYYNNTWHLFFQYYPDSTVWGPMHWGHATSTDLVHWTQQPIALFPDSLGYIFSGSVVADVKNSSGLGANGKTPLIAIFTHHDPVGEKNGTLNFQNQSIAYSLDAGMTWTKYSGNPVLKNPGIKDFRDPKVMWFEPEQKWVMSLATKDRISFYSSKDLKTWTKESEFGEHAGSHGGVWECPDLFSFDKDGKKTWVLLVSINPGGPNGGSATQYFIGDFNGKTFTSSQQETKWIDQGTDNYAGVTFSGTGDRKIFLGWMSNWQYGQVVPTTIWRSAMTVPRELSLENINGNYYLASMPAKELEAIENRTENKTDTVYPIEGAAKLKTKFSASEDFSIKLSNDKGENWIVGYEQKTDRFYIDRTHSGKIDFEKGFASKIYSKRTGTNNTIDITLVIDNASAEFFADGGLTTMTSIFFPTTNYQKISIGGNKAEHVELTHFKSIW